MDEQENEGVFPEAEPDDRKLDYTGEDRKGDYHGEPGEAENSDLGGEAPERKTTLFYAGGMVFRKQLKSTGESVPLRKSHQ